MVSDLEKKRLENIARNKELFRSLNLDSITNDIQKELELKKIQEIKKKSEKRKLKDNVKANIPIRKSRRLQGIKIEDTDDYQKLIKEKELTSVEKKKIDDLKQMKLPGDISLIEILKSQNKENDNDNNNEEGIIKNFLKISSDNFSSGDFFEIVSKNDKSNKNLNESRESINKLELYENFTPNRLQLTADRLSYIDFHPTISEKIIIGGDILGNLGIWNPKNDTEDEPSLTKLNLHGKYISKIVHSFTNNNQFYTASYDNSIRINDLNNLKSTEILGLLDENGNEVGISDVQVSSPFSTSNEFNNLIYFTTLDGKFGSFDIRTKPKLSNLELFRLSNKKIGGFSLNPLNNYQIATGSLDRTMKIFDLRKVYNNSKWSDKFPDEKCYHSYGKFSSKLSISSADWNLNGNIVCNGYADTINIFNFGNTNDWGKTSIQGKSKKTNKDLIPSSFQPNHVIKHNCRTGKWVSILKARWQLNPKDGHQKFIIGNMKRFFDIYNENGIQIGHLNNSSMTAVPAVCNFHPTENWIIGGTATGKCILYS